MLIDELILAEKKIDRTLYSSGPYWDYKNSRAILEIKKKGLNDFRGKNFSEFKNKLADILVEKIYPISNEIKKLLKDEKYIDNILKIGSIEAEKIARKKVNDIKQKIGF